VKRRTDEGAKHPVIRRASLLAAWCAWCSVSWHRINRWMQWRNSCVYVTHTNSANSHSFSQYCSL